MIKLDRRDIKGYLRTGRLLQRMKDDKKCQTALQIYVLGLRNVPPSNENYRVLQMVHDKLTLQLSPPKSVDPFVALPVELVEIILNYLEFHQRLSCLRVTKHWRTFLLSRTQFWRNLDFSHAKRNVNLRTIQRYLYYSQQRITRVTLHRHSDQNTLNALTKLKSLQSLSFGSTEYSTGSIIPALATNHLKGGSLTLVHIGENTLLTLDGVSQALKVCPTLTRAWFDSVQRKGRIGTTVEWPEDLKNLLDLRMRVPQPPPIAGQSHLSPCLVRIDRHR